ncbi:hypothetical protein Prum_046970 [Phytohabitans rumicis]|uniref:Uncharacterized protein n=1 Tax=Phytohabitans rumicis TaxID=1076125 RepID=A0A6V8LEG8_9ACTN|nr:hypothetical protein Prum_046970 [Phytohabitans rumicis]
MVDGDAPSFEDETGPAYALADGVPYVRGWTDAHRAAEVLRAELRAWGIEGRTAVRAEVVCGVSGWSSWAVFRRNWRSCWRPCWLRHACNRPARYRPRVGHHTLRSGLRGVGGLAEGAGCPPATGEAGGHRAALEGIRLRARLTGRVAVGNAPTPPACRCPG